MSDVRCVFCSFKALMSRPVTRPGVEIRFVVGQGKRVERWRRVFENGFRAWAYKAVKLPLSVAEAAGCEF
jgi:hypothetical protein